jgi:hypothetical protein
MVQIIALAVLSAGCGVLFPADPGPRKSGVGVGLDGASAVVHVALCVADPILSVSLVDRDDSELDIWRVHASTGGLAWTFPVMGRLPSGYVIEEPLKAVPDKREEVQFRHRAS